METLPKTLPSFTWHFIKKQWKGFLAAQIFAFGWAIDHTLWPVVIMLLINAITTYAGNRPDAMMVLWPILLMGAALWIFVEVNFRLSGIVMAKILPKFEADVRMAMVNYAVQHSYSYFSDNFAGSIANKISDMPQTLTRILQLIIYLFMPVVLAMVIAIALFAMVQITFALILLSWIVIHLSICFYYSKECDQLSNAHAEARSVLAGNIVDSLSNQLSVKLFSRNKYENQYLQRFQQTEKEKHTISLWTIEKMKIFLGIAAFLITGLGLNAYMIYSWMQGHIDAGEVVFIFNTSWNITMMAWIAGLEIPTLF